jgi:S1-C subfamily serine protease
MPSLDQFSDDISKAVEKAGASVVGVNGRHGKGASGIVWDKGLVLTADHVLETDEGITVTDGSAEHPATIAGRDGASDLALLRVEGLGAAAALRGASPVKVGNIVLTVGRPRGLEVTLGVVSSVDAQFRGWRGGGLDGMIQTDAPLNQGFSGGPLIDPSGAVVGVNSWYYGRGTTRALPLEAAARVAASLAEHGRVRHAYLGVGAQPVYLDEKAKAASGQDSGLMVISVETGSPAAAAGLSQGDVIVSLGGHTTARMRDLYVALRKVDAGSDQAARVVRAGDVKDIKVTLGERPE